MFLCPPFSRVFFFSQAPGAILIGQPIEAHDTKITCADRRLFFLTDLPTDAAFDGCKTLNFTCVARVHSGQ